MNFIIQNWQWSIVAVCSGAILAFDLIRSASNSSMLSPIQGTLLINHQNPIIIDIRPKAEYEQGHITKAINLPFDEFNTRISEFTKYQKKPILLYCNNGTRSNSAIKKFKKQNFENLFQLRGGLTEWKKASLPLTK